MLLRSLLKLNIYICKKCDQQLRCKLLHFFCFSKHYGEQSYNTSLRKTKIHRSSTHSATHDNISPLTIYCAITALFSQVCCTYLVNGWQGGLIKIISKDNLSNSFSVIPWTQKKPRRMLSVVNCMKFSSHL